MKPIAWYDPSNGVVSTDRDCPLFTPLGQVWPLYPKGEWVDLTDEERNEILVEAVQDKWDDKEIIKAIEAKLKEKNT
jgi:hypothetical protein